MTSASSKLWHKYVSQKDKWMLLYLLQLKRKLEHLL